MLNKNSTIQFSNIPSRRNLRWIIIWQRIQNNQQREKKKTFQNPHVSFRTFCVVVVRISKNTSKFQPQIPRAIELNIDLQYLISIPSPNAKLSTIQYDNRTYILNKHHLSTTDINSDNHTYFEDTSTIPSPDIRYKYQISVFYLYPLAQ